MATPEEDYDTVEFVTKRLRVVYGFLAGLFGVLVYGATHIYDFGMFVQQAKNHEESQDTAIKECKSRLEVQIRRHEVSKKDHNKVLKVLLGQHDQIREMIISSMPARKRSRYRREFANQRSRERDLLLD